jgi:hypothetical protein
MAKTSRHGRGVDCECEARNDTLANRKQKEVTGDMCPVGVSPTVWVISKPKCSTSERMSRQPIANSKIAASVPKPTIATPIQSPRRPNGVRTRTLIPAPYNTNRTAVLGAIGIKLAPKLASSGHPKTHPSSATTPSAAATMPAIGMTKTERLAIWGCGCFMLCALLPWAARDSMSPPPQEP